MDIQPVGLPHPDQGAVPRHGDAAGIRVRLGVPQAQVFALPWRGCGGFKVKSPSSPRPWCCAGPGWSSTETPTVQLHAVGVAVVPVGHLPQSLSAAAAGVQQVGGDTPLLPAHAGYLPGTDGQF